VVPLGFKASPPGWRYRLRKTEWTALTASRLPSLNATLPRKAKLFSWRTLAETTRIAKLGGCQSILQHGLFIPQILGPFNRDETPAPISKTL